MGRRSIRRVRSTDPARRLELARSMTPVFMAHGTRSVTMDAIARGAGVSKATLYNHFESLEEMVAHVVGLKVETIMGFQTILNDADRSFADRYAEAFELLASQIAGVSSTFLDDVRSDFPDVFARIDALIDLAGRELRAFYARGMEAGVFRALHPDLLARTDLSFFRTLTDPRELRDLDLSIEEACRAFYDIRCGGLYAR